MSLCAEAPFFAAMELMPEQAERFRAHMGDCGPCFDEVMRLWAVEAAGTGGEEWRGGEEEGLQRGKGNAGAPASNRGRAGGGGVNGALRERRPSLPGWVQLDARRLPAELLAGAEQASAWRNGTTQVISALVLADLPDGAGVGLQWHISVSRLGTKRPKPHDLRRALRAFAMQGAEEDNHHPGTARHFWVPVDEAHRVECQCKTDETVVVEQDGYTWTNPKSGPCRGCELQALTGKLCPLHADQVRLVAAGGAR